MNLRLIAGAAALAAALTSSFAQPRVMDVNTGKNGAPIQKTMYGIFFEDINYGADGGLYGEMLVNRSFEFKQSLTGWTTFGNVNVKDDGPFERCPHYVELAWPGHADRLTGMQNSGYGGISLKQGEDYRLTLWAKAAEGEGGIKVELIDQLTDSEPQAFVTQELKITSGEWKKYELIMRSPKNDTEASLRILLNGKAPVCLEHVSLFPVKTFKNRKNGMRADLAQALADMHPGVFRFPGGCIVEGADLQTRYQWKNTIGPVENRPVNENRWQYAMKSRISPDYYQSYGLGFFEYFQLSEDIGAEPLPVLNVGMACQFQNKDDSANVPMSELQPYIQDCLDLIEFANGDTTTTWGRKRAEMGHPAPFNLKYIAVGNEQWEEPYFKRLPPFVKAIREKYPDIKIIGTCGPAPEGEMFEHGWKAMREIGVDLVDEHYYKSEEWFRNSSMRYDSYSRKGPKVFAGEYACHGDGKKWNHYETSLYEAAFMTGLERNADVVLMATYAPLFARVDAWQWRPDLIWFDNARMFKSVSYYVQQMYACNKGTNVLKLTMNGKPVAGQQGQAGLYASAAADNGDGSVIVKVVNTGKTTQPVSVNLKGMKGERTAQTTTLTCTDMDAENTLEEPEKIVPKTGTLTCKAGKKCTVIEDEIAPMTFRVYRIKK